MPRLCPTWPRWPSGAEWGYTQALLDALQAAGDAIEAAKAEQLKLLGSNTAQTEAYYRLANAIWARMRALNEVRSLAFPDDYVRWERYALYPKSFYKKKSVEKGE